MDWVKIEYFEDDCEIFVAGPAVKEECSKTKRDFSQLFWFLVKVLS